MKKFWNQHRTGIFIGAISAVMLAVAVHIIMVLCGFHFLYSPEQHNNWNAVSAVAAWVSILVSVAAVAASIVAIVYAIKIPKTIADRQDKIALFQKRYDVLQSFAKCRIFYLTLLKSHSLSDIQNACCRLLGIEKFDDMTEKCVLQKSSDFLYTFNQIPFLFTDISDEDTLLVFNCLLDFLLVVAQNKKIEEISEKRKLFFDAAYEFNEKYFPQMIAETTVSNF